MCTPDEKTERTPGGYQFTSFLKMQCFDVCLKNALRKKCVCYLAFSLSTQKSYLFLPKMNLIEYIELDPREVQKNKYIYIYRTPKVVQKQYITLTKNWLH